MTITCFNVGTLHTRRESSPRPHALCMYQTRPRDWSGHRLPTGKHSWGPLTRMSTCVQCNKKMFVRKMPMYIIYTLYGPQPYDACATRRESCYFCHTNSVVGPKGNYEWGYVSVQAKQMMFGTVTLRCWDDVPRIHLHTTSTVALLDAPSAHTPSRLKSVGRLNCC